MRQTVLIGLVMIVLFASCSAHRELMTSPATGQVSRLVIEDENGRVIAHDMLPGLIAQEITSLRVDNNLAIVQKLNRKTATIVETSLNAMLEHIGRDPIRLSQTLKQGQITCHKIFMGDNFFAGIGTNECRDALLYRMDPQNRPFLMDDVGSKFSGMTEESISAEIAEEANPITPVCVHSGPTKVSWEVMFPFLWAQIFPKQMEGTRKIELHYCSAINNLDLIPDDERDPDLEQAARSSLIRLRSGETREQSEVLLIHYLQDFENFPENFLQDEQIQAMLLPILEQELNVCDITFARADLP